MKPIFRDSGKVIVAIAALCGLFLGGGLVCGWALWDRSLNPTSFGYYAQDVLTILPALSLILFVGASLASAMALSFGSRRLLARSRAPKVVLACLILVSLILAANAGLWVFAAPSPGQGNPSSCTYDVFLDGGTPVAWSVRTRTTVLSSASGDLGALVNALPKSNQVVCFEPGRYAVGSAIRVVGESNVTLLFSQGAVMTATSPWSSFRLLQVASSSGVLVVGGRWVGPRTGDLSDIEIDRGSNNVIVEGVDASGAGRDGILVRNDTTPALKISLLDNYVHGNGRFGIQDYENSTFQSLDVTISGNLAEDNWIGGIYTNGVGGANIVDNTVRNTVGTLPGAIGIGVTNGANDTVADNRVDHMLEYGIQAFYNNDTLIANNYSGFNAGASDQSGITNDHSFYDVVVNNTVVSNGLAGVHVERSSYVTVRGNNATGNGRFGIEFFHGTMATTAHETVTGNVCSDNRQAGIILNSGVDSTISLNSCRDNSGPGVFLYNDLGLAGSSGNVIANNSLGDDRASPSARTQTFGVESVNGAEANTVVGNSFFGDTISNVSLVGADNVVEGNVELNAPPPGPAGP